MSFVLILIALIELLFISFRGGLHKDMGHNDLMFALVCIFASVWTASDAVMISADTQTSAYIFRAIGLVGMHGTMGVGLFYVQSVCNSTFEEETQKSFILYMATCAIVSYVFTVFPVTVTFIKTANGMFYLDNHWIGRYLQIIILILCYYFWFKFSLHLMMHHFLVRDGVIARCFIESGIVLIIAGVVDIVFPMLSITTYPWSVLATFISLFLIFRTRNLHGDIEINDRRVSEYIFHDVKVPYIVLNSDFAVHEINDKACKILGGVSDSIVGTPLFDWIKYVSEDVISDLQADIANRAEKITINQLVARYTDIAIDLETKVMYDRYAQVLCICVMIHDRSEEENYEKAINAGKREVELANRVKQSFMSRITKGLRDPLESILDTAVSVENEVPSMVLPRINHIKENASALLGTMNDIIDIASMESESFAIENIKYDIKDMLESVMSECAMKINEDRVTLISMINASMPRELIGDAVRLRQVLYNLLDNAVKYTDKGYVTLQLDYRVHYRKVMLNFLISDTGSGIKKENMETIFGVLDEDENSVLGSMGNGLGLSLCRNIIKLMGGEISVRSAYGRGTSFSFSIEQRIDSEKSVVPFMEFHENVLLLETDQLRIDSEEKILKEMGLRYDAIAIKELLIAEVIPVGGNYSVIFADSQILRRHRQYIVKNYPNARIIAIYNYHEYQRLEDKTDAICSSLFFGQISDVLKGE